MILSILLLPILGAGPGQSTGGEPIVAVASNFATVAEQLAEEFAATTGHRVVLVTGSTGKIYAQISNGAPFSAFLAADEKRPTLLEQRGAARLGSRFTYAVGRLVLWSRRDDLVDQGGAILREGTFRHLAVANPKLAPYGQAAQEVLTHLGLWDSIQPRLVRGENIGQAFQFVFSGNAELGLVALSEYRGLDPSQKGSVWMVPTELHQPIRQQAVLLEEQPVARAFLEFLKSPAGRDIITSFGYDLPVEPPTFKPEVR